MSRHASYHPPTTSWLDVWLPRVSYISQFGLLLLTVGGLYFTVLPLYQKALLDEAIARKEIELQQTLAALEKAYLSVRQIAVQQFIVQAIDNCSPFSRLLVDFEHQPKQKSGPRNSSENELLSIDTKSCIANAIDRSKAITDLRQGDRSLIEREATRIASSLASHQQRAIKEFDEVPVSFRSNPDQFKLTSDFRSRMLDFLAKHRPLNEIEEQRKELMVEQAQEAVVVRYHQTLLNEITSIRRLNWPTEKPSAK